MGTGKQTRKPAAKKSGGRGGRKPKALRRPAIEFSHNQTKMYLTVIKAAELFPLCHVSRVEEEPEEGYQRLLDKKRAQKIANYLDDGRVIPGALVLSAQPSAKFAFDSAKQEVVFSPVKRAFLVIDGQHRLYGAHLADSEIPIAVCIMLDLSQEDEVTYFLDVNGTQRGVPKTLQIEITKFLVEQGSLDDTRIRLFKELNTNPASPLCGRLSAAASRVGKLSHVPFKNALNPLLVAPPLSNATFSQKLQILLNFLCAIETHLAKDGRDDRLRNAAFFQAVFGAFKEVAYSAKARHETYKQEAFESVLQPIQGIDWDAHSGTNKQAIAAFTQHIVGLVSEEERISDDML